MDDTPFTSASRPRSGHPAALARDFQQKVSAAASFLVPGATIGANCILVTRREDMDAWEAGLAEHGLSPDDGTIFIVPIETWLPPRGVNSIRMARRLYERIEGSRAEGRELHIAIDMAWTLETGTSSDEVCHWEATCDHLLTPEPDVCVVCVYGLHELGCDLIHAGLRTHSVITVSDRSIANPFFEAPAILEREPSFNQCSSDPDFVGNLLQHFFAPV